jgi:hypothetical protein
MEDDRPYSDSGFTGSAGAVIPSPGAVPILRITRRFAIFDLQEETIAARKAGRRWDSKEMYMALDKNDESILTDIDRLVKEEEHLYGKSEITIEDRERLAELKVHLDQCWDLLRQRRALREFGKDPDAAKVRPANIVENYEQ